MNFIMTTVSVSSNNTSIMNSTEAFDYYCTKMPVGPWIWGGVTIPCACMGAPASVWLLWVLIQRQRSGLSNDIYMLNCTMMDMIFNLFSIPGLLNYFVWKDDLYAKIGDILYCFNMSGRPLFVACICVDCYIAVIYPILYMKMKKSSYRLVVCAVVWGFTLFDGAMLTLDRHLFSTSVAVVAYLLSLPIIATCDLAILHALRKPDPSRRSNIHPQKRRALQTITNSLVMTLVSYLPPLFGSGFLTLTSVSPQEKNCVTIALLIAPMLGSVIMPLLYLENLGSLRGLERCRCVSQPSSQPAQGP